MKITALEIRQKEFQKGFRGCDKDEVQAFLLSLSQEWERMVEQNKELAIRLENAEKDVAKLREVEDSLFKTLKTAETTGANVVEQANKASELILQEARLRAEQTIDESQRKSDKVFTTMLTEFSELEREFRGMENLRDNLHAEIRNLCNDSLDKIERVDTGRKDFTNIKNMASKLVVENQSHKEVEPAKVKDEPVVESKENTEASIKFEVPKEEIKDGPKEEKKENNEGDDKSFFDQVEG